eukprot:Skav231756  [mRNA]  locus=scaffold695:53922:55259:- [translate_table: standard]
MATDQEQSSETLKILLRNGVTGEDLEEITVNAADPLTTTVERDFPQLVPFDLLYDGLKVGLLSPKDLSLPDGARVDLLRLPKPKEFQEVARLHLTDVGYNSHDSYLDRVCCEDPGAFVVSFQRRFKGEDFASHKNNVRLGQVAPDGAYRVEVVMLDLAAFSGDEDVKRAYCGPDDGQLVRLLAIAGDGTMYFQVQDESSASLYTSHGEEFTKIYTFPEHFEAKDCLFVGPSVFIVARDRQQELYIVEVDRNGTERRLHQLPRLLGEANNQQKRRFPGRFLGLDDTKQALWLLTPKCLMTLQLPLLEQHTCCLTSDLCKAGVGEDKAAFLKSKGVVLNPQTRELLLHFDASLLFNFSDAHEHGHELEMLSGTCFLRCRAPSLGDRCREWEVTYAEPADLVCSEMFAIDGFSDSFCIGQSHLVRSTDPDKMRLMVLDAGGSVWQMEL